MNPFDFKTEDFDYNLPKELIAQTPSLERDHSRLIVLDRKTKEIKHKMFYDILDYLNPGDLLVLNDTKVIPANITGVKEGGGAKIEVLLVRPVADYKSWICLVKPAKRLKVGSTIVFSKDLKGRVLEKLESGEEIISFEGELRDFMLKNGDIPLPPYINAHKKNNDPKKGDGINLKERYQTVYAEKEGASAAPTAGLHFTKELISQIELKKVKVDFITLHTGLGTFKPVYAEYIKDHKMHDESFSVKAKTLENIKSAKRIIAVGTTTVRTLETLFIRGVLSEKKSKDISSSTDLFIYPGFKFNVVNSMITNFHVPKSTLLMLVSAFAQGDSENPFDGKDLVLKAYKEAIEKKYRFFSFGDSMLML